MRPADGVASKTASSFVLGQGEALLKGIDLPTLGYRVKEHVFTEAAMRFVVGR